jgi:hypothetical protein
MPFKNGTFQAILMAFRSINALDKTVESCTITISAKDSKTRIELKCRYNVTKIYSLPFIECESIKVYCILDSKLLFFLRQCYLSAIDSRCP